jgi:hypothetical protein
VGAYSLSTARQETLDIAMTLAVRTESLQKKWQYINQHRFEIWHMQFQLTQAELSLRSNFPSSVP